MRWYFQMSLRAKLILSFGIVVFLALGLSTISLISMNNTQNIASALYTNLSERYQYINRAQDNTVRLHKAVTVYLDQGSGARSRMDSVLNDTRSIFSSLKSSYYVIEVDEVKRAEANLANQLTSRLVPLMEAGQREQAHEMYIKELAPLFDKLLEEVDKVQNAQIQDGLSQVNGLASNSSMIMVGALTLLIFVLSMIIALVTAAYFKGAIYFLLKEIELLEHQDLSHKINTTVYKDEFGTLISSVDKFRQMFSLTLSRVRDASERVNLDMEQATRATSRLANNAHDSESRTLTVAAAADEMVATTQNIASNCSNAAAISNQSTNVTNSAMSKVKSSISEIFRQAEQTKNDSKQIEKMINQSKSIGSIVGTIDDIAAQTNLLALNAAIEAARAGNAGRGFAVVADEVRALASRTSTSTNEITQMVNIIEQDANLASESMTNSVTNMDNLANNTAGLEQVLSDILTYVSDVNEQVTQIATAAEEQTATTAEISNNMQNLTASSKEVATIATETNEIISKTFDNVKLLTDELSHFKL